MTETHWPAGDSGSQMLQSWRDRFIAYLHDHWVSDDASHDIHHLHRVWRTCVDICRREQAGADELVILAACYFHDFVAVPKNDPARSHASLLSADRAAALIPQHFPDFPEASIPAVHHAIHAHSFSAQVKVETLEAAILQDADRMEALGAIGLARMFYTACIMNSELFDPDDPLAMHRPLDDRKYSLDHISAKLLTLPQTMNTPTGRRMAEDKAHFLVKFRDVLLEEIAET